MRQETVIEMLQQKLIEIYDPKFSYSNAKIKERLALYLEEFIAKRNELKSDISSKLKTNFNFVEKV